MVKNKFIQKPGKLIKDKGDHYKILLQEALHLAWKFFEERNNKI